MPADRARNVSTDTSRGLNQYALGGTAAEMYERNMVPAIFEPFAHDLMEFANLKTGEKILDVACGTGVVARLAWPKVRPSGRVVGLDVNSQMLDVARAASQQQAAEIAWVEGNVTEMPFPSGASIMEYLRLERRSAPRFPATPTPALQILGSPRSHGRCSRRRVDWAR